MPYFAVWQPHPYYHGEDVQKFSSPPSNIVLDGKTIPARSDYMTWDGSTDTFQSASLGPYQGGANIPNNDMLYPTWPTVYSQDWHHCWQLSNQQADEQVDGTLEREADGYAGSGPISILGEKYIQKERMHMKKREAQRARQQQQKDLQKQLDNATAELCTTKQRNEELEQENAILRSRLNQVPTAVADDTEDNSCSKRQGQPKSSPLIDPRPYHFGSDKHFTEYGFIPPRHIDSEAAATSRQILEIETVLQHHTSAVDNSLTTSPVQHHADKDVSQDSSSHSSKDSEPSFQLQKRRKSKHNHTGVSNERVSPTKPKSNNRKSPKNARPTKISQSDFRADPAAVKRRKSSLGTTSKTLMEDQMRENHIRSEQKRRNRIKAGLQELDQLVPALKAGGHSKSQVLVEAASFLEGLVNGNWDLRQRLGFSLPAGSSPMSTLDVAEVSDPERTS